MPSFTEGVCKGLPAPGPRSRGYFVRVRSPRCASSIAAISILVISIIASNARLAAAGSGSVTAFSGFVLREIPST